MQPLISTNLEIEHKRPEIVVLLCYCSIGSGVFVKGLIDRLWLAFFSWNLMLLLNFNFSCFLGDFTTHIWHCLKRHFYFHQEIYSQKGI